MVTRLFHVDAFTDRSFSGNPAAVCLLTSPVDQSWMQQVASEMNLSEIAFLVEQENHYSLRWFTPKIEVDLCGHATLASAHILWETSLLDLDKQARFYTRSGLLTADYKDGFIELDFPALHENPAHPPEPLIEALGITPIYSGKFDSRYILEVESEEIVRNLKPDFSALRALPERGVTVTSLASNDAYDFVSRYFAPWVGVDEDPVNGSSHCCLGPYWSKRLGKDVLKAYQASARGGTIYIRVKGERNFLGGQAVTIARGELLM